MSPAPLSNKETTMSSKTTNAGTLEQVVWVNSDSTPVGNSGVLNADSDYMLVATQNAYIKIAKDNSDPVDSLDTYLPKDTPIFVRTTSNKVLLQATQVSSSGIVYATELS